MLIYVLGIVLVAAVGLAIVGRGRRSGRVDQNQFDAGKADSLTTSFPDFRTGGEYLPPPDDGRPLH